MDASEQKSVSLRNAAFGWWKESVAQRGFRLTLRTLASEIWGFVRESTPEQRRRRYGDMEYDWDHRVDTTSATVSWRNRLLGVFQSPYQPTEPALFAEMLQGLAIDFSSFVFVDLGSGKGRTLMMAAEYPFSRIVGVELLPEVNRVARENLKRYASATQRCFAIETVCGDARQFPFPVDPMVLYLFNPLPEPGLEEVIDGLECSLRKHPRKLLVIYHNPLLEHVLSRRPWLKKVGGTHQYCVYESVG